MHTNTVESTWDRALPLSGVVFTTAMVAAAAAFPTPSGGDVSAASDPAWLAHHYNAVIAQSYVRGLAALAFIALAVAVGAACRRVLPDRSALPTTAVVGGAFSGGLVLLAQAAALATALYGRGGGDPQGVRALGALQDGFLDLSSIPAIMLFAAAGLTGWRTQLLPRWLTVLTLLGVPFALIDAASYDGGPLEAVGILGLIYFLTWSLLTGVHLTRTHQPGPTLAQQAEPALVP